MTTRRDFFRRGLAALSFGVSAASARGAVLPPPPASAGRPILPLPPIPPSVVIGGLPFAPWFLADDFVDPQTIPFHLSFSGALPPPAEDVDVAIVGGGISGLAAAYFLRHESPVLFDLRPRFGGNALGERWRGTSFSLGSAYVISPDPGSVPHRLYHELGLHQHRRLSFPPDPMEVGGVAHAGYWNGAGFGAAEQLAFARYADVVTGIAEGAFPEIPLSRDPVQAAIVRALDRRTFREDLEARMGMPLTPMLAAGVQAYFYSSFGAGMEEVSAASGWNFVAAEESGRWVFPGGNAALAEALWRELAEVEARRPAAAPRLLRPGCRVVDVRRVGDRVHVTWVESGGAVRTLRTRFVVMAGSKHVVKHVLHDLVNLDPPKHAAMQRITTSAYLVANILVDAPVTRDFYDLFLIGGPAFPVTPVLFEESPRPVDVVNGHYARESALPRGVLTCYWPLPFPSARFTLMLDDPYERYAALFAAKIRETLGLLGIPESAVVQIRLARWGHAMPIAVPGFIADGMPEELLRPFQDRIYFANQDDWALPAIENSLADAAAAAHEIRRRL